MHTTRCFTRGLGAAVIAGLALTLSAATSHATMISLTLESTADAQLVFDRTDSGGGVGSFTFTDATMGGGIGNDFLITFPGEVALLFGKLDGTFTIGTITDNGLPPGTTGYTEIATVTGSGTFSIDDGLGNLLTATLGFSTISTTFVNVGGGISFGNLSSGGGISLTGISYSDDNTVLQDLAAAGEASMLITFGFDPSQSLRELTDNGAGPTTTSASYTGSLSADVPLSEIPAPPSAALLGLGLLSWVAPRCLRRRRPLAE